MVHGGSLRAGHGAYAQFVRVDGQNLFRIPENVSFDEAATYGVAFQTATLGLYERLKLPVPYGAADKEPTPILVWGGASMYNNDIGGLQLLRHHYIIIASVGTIVIQLAKLSGLTVITTASPKNAEYLKSLGADYVFPYNDPNTPAEIKKLTNGKLYLGYDTISEKGTTQLVIDAFGSDSDIPEGKKKELINLLYIPPGALDEKAASVTRFEILTYTTFGVEVTVYGVHLAVSPSDYAFSVRSYEMLERLLEEEKIQHQKVKVMGGLEHVSEGFTYMKEGKNSAEKLVYHPLETKG
jgi:threonine dehydrogenase-like Zn-dependent dehydrogenase